MLVRRSLRQERAAGGVGDHAGDDWDGGGGHEGWPEWVRSGGRQGGEVAKEESRNLETAERRNRADLRMVRGTRGTNAKAGCPGRRQHLKRQQRCVDEGGG
jgi:hypothetical protein